jgi:hypothetical protein
MRAAWLGPAGGTSFLNPLFGHRFGFKRGHRRSSSLLDWSGLDQGLKTALGMPFFVVVFVCGTRS